MPLGQLNLTTEVENFPTWPCRQCRAGVLSKSALPADRYALLECITRARRPAGSHGVTGPELMELMRQQAVNFGTRIVTDDIVKVDFKRHPFVLTPLARASRSRR